MEWAGKAGRCETGYGDARQRDLVILVHVIAFVRVAAPAGGGGAGYCEYYRNFYSWHRNVLTVSACRNQCEYDVNRRGSYICIRKEALWLCVYVYYLMMSKFCVYMTRASVWFYFMNCVIDTPGVMEFLKTGNFEDRAQNWYDDTYSPLPPVVPKTRLLVGPTRPDHVGGSALHGLTTS